MLADDVETSGACGWTSAISPLLDLEGYLGGRTFEAASKLFFFVNHDGSSRNKSCNEEMAVKR